MSIQRYDFDGDYGYCGCGISENADGDFVKYTDHMDRLAAVERDKDAALALAKAECDNNDTLRARMEALTELNAEYVASRMGVTAGLTAVRDAATQGGDK